MKMLMLRWRCETTSHEAGHREQVDWRTRLAKARLEMEAIWRPDKVWAAFVR
jgi:hypothetical protein